VRFPQGKITPSFEPRNGECLFWHCNKISKKQNLEGWKSRKLKILNAQNLEWFKISKNSKSQKNSKFRKSQNFCQKFQDFFVFPAKISSRVNNHVKNFVSKSITVRFLEFPLLGPENRILLPLLNTILIHHKFWCIFDVFWWFIHSEKSIWGYLETLELHML
jgi:hypothetical protein